jgi:RNA polymerase sporulation-specific sigma factor
MMLISSAILMLRLGANSGSFPRPLSAEDERKCIDDWVGEGDIAARNKLVVHNLRLVAHIIKKYYTHTSDSEDLISIGTVGLIKGVSTYRPDKGVRLATYAAKCIENEILMFFRGQKKSAGDLSLSESIDVDGDGNSLSLMDIISDDEDMLERVSRQEIGRTIREHVDKLLLQREAMIIKMRYGLSGTAPLTQREVAQICRISRSYVSRIEKRALEKLRGALGDI